MKKLLPHHVESLKKIRAICLKCKNILLVYHFGSTAITKRNQIPHPNSDIDLAVLFQKQPKPAEYRSLYASFMRVIGHPRVEVIVLNHADPLLCYEVITGGKILFARNHDVENDFEMKLLSRYFDTRHLRQKQNQLLMDSYGV